MGRKMFRPWDETTEEDLALNKKVAIILGLIIAVIGISVGFVLLPY